MGKETIANNVTKKGVMDETVVAASEEYPTDVSMSGEAVGIVFEEGMQGNVCQKANLMAEEGQESSDGKTQLEEARVKAEDEQQRGDSQKVSEKSKKPGRHRSLCLCGSKAKAPRPHRRTVA